LALNALHRWLHSPLGDDALVEDAQDFHVQLETECPEECVRIETEERLAWGNAQREGLAAEARATELGMREVWDGEQRAGAVEVRRATDEEQRVALDAAAAEYIEDMATAEPRSKQ
jgi:hypothetical protein